MIVPIPTGGKPPPGITTLSDAIDDVLSRLSWDGPYPPTRRTPCPKCWTCHRYWFTFGRCLLGPVEWCVGRGPFASVSDCPRGRTVMLHRTEAEAFAAKKLIDRTACGGVCRRLHAVLDLRRIAAEVAA